MTPFVLRQSSQFEPAGPPSLSSSRYARDYNEVKEIGALDSVSRTDDQSMIAKFWYENASSIWSRFARVAAQTQGLDDWETARLLALINLAMSDGIIAGWQAKFDFNRWRPVTAIRAGDSDGNEATVGDTMWSSFLNTPPQPDYPSGHSVVAGAAATGSAEIFWNRLHPVHSDQRGSVCWFNTIIHKLLRSRRGERRCARLCRHSHPFSGERWNQAGRKDWPFCIR